ncbi:serine hydrolase [Thalassotalea sp. G2M2-11]|uniref:serine hydrolase n=1 Tax=Thalassotalea sp. G2M2-11 TaxID=2787627 RepID=UPI0019CFB666
MNTFKYWFIFIFSMIVAFSGNSSELAGKLTKITEAYIEHQMFRGNVLVAIDDEIIANVSSDNIEFSSRFEIGSIAKQFTAALIYLLEEKQLVDFGFPISTYVKGFSEHEIGTITINEILEHRSGLPRDFISLNERGTNRNMTSKERLRRLKDLSISPEKSKQYSNAGFAVISLIIESVTNKPFEQVLVNNIIKPLNLLNTGIITEKVKSSLVQGINRLGDDEIVFPSQLQNYAIGHGAMYSSVMDLYQWQLALISGKVVSVKSFNSMLANNHGLFRYLYNWPSNTGAKGQAFTHSGSNESFVANVSTYLDHKLIVVTLANEKPTYVNSLYNQLANAVLGFDEALPYENLLDKIATKVLSGDLDGAIKVFSQAKLAQRWDLPSALQLNRYGYLYLENKHFDSAEKLFDFLTQVYPDYKNGWDSYAEALDANDNKDKAKKIRQKYLH